MPDIRRGTPVVLPRRLRLWGRWVEWWVLESHRAQDCPHDGVRLACLWCQIGFSLEQIASVACMANYDTMSDVV